MKPVTERASWSSIPLFNTNVLFDESSICWVNRIDQSFVVRTNKRRIIKHCFHWLLLRIGDLDCVMYMLTCGTESDILAAWYKSWQGVISSCMPCVHLRMHHHYLSKAQLNRMLQNHTYSHVSIVSSGVFGYYETVNQVASALNPDAFVSFSPDSQRKLPTLPSTYERWR